MVLAAADPSGSVGLVEVGFFSVKSSGTALGKILRRPAQTAIAAGSVVLWVKNRVLRRARVALLVLLRAYGACKESGGLAPFRCRRPSNSSSGQHAADKSDRSDRWCEETAGETLGDNWVRYGAHRSFCHRDLRLRDGRLLVRHKQLFTTAQPFFLLLFAATSLSQFLYGSVFIPLSMTDNGSSFFVDYFGLCRRDFNPQNRAAYADCRSRRLDRVSAFACVTRDEPKRALSNVERDRPGLLRA